MPGDERQRQRRQEGGEAREAQGERAVGALIDEPADADVLHLHRETVEEARADEEPEVADPERGPAGHDRLVGCGRIGGRGHVVNSALRGARVEGTCP